jgi:hypothetical protein
MWIVMGRGLPEQHSRTSLGAEFPVKKILSPIDPGYAFSSIDINNSGVTMRRALLLGFGLAWIAGAHGGQGCAAAPKGWEIETEAVSGPFCADVLLEKPAQAQPDSENEGARKLRVYEEGQPAFETDDAALCKTCGGVLGDPFQEIEWKKQTLAVRNFGGSRESWGETWKFAKRGGRWLIAGWDREYVDRATGDIWSESVNALTGKATADFEPGADSRKKPRHLACSHPTKTPEIRRLAVLREKEPFACGMKIDWED